jgi:hypothetical protein
MELIKNQFAQTFVITHEETFKRCAENKKFLEKSF